MNRHSSWFLITGMALVSLFAYAQESKPRLIIVTGTAEQKVAPDEVMLQLGVENRNRDLSAAKVETDSIVKKVIEQAESFGITEDDLQTSELNIEPMYDDNDNGKRVQFFELRRSIAIRLQT
ncbi:MAG TPA: SIMPL domain-containing protein [Terriglobales bacterium]|nr:SIMPL domain-containing protein [Terriglobales bacterium]